MAKAMQTQRLSITRRVAAAVAHRRGFAARTGAVAARRGALLGLAFAAFLAIAVTATTGTGAIGGTSVARADSTAQRSSTHVVVKLKPGASIDWLLQKISTWRYSSGSGSGYFSAVLEKSFPGTEIYVLRVTSGDAAALANRLPVQKAQVAWAEPGIFTPLAEASRFSAAAYERFNQAAFEKFSQTAYERFSQATYERFAQAAFEKFSQAAYEKFAQAAYEEFSSALYERFSQVAYEKFAQVAYEEFSRAAADKFTQAAYEQFSEAAYEQFRQASYEKFNQAAYEQFRQAFFERFSQAVYDSLMAAIAGAFEDPEFQLAFRQLLEELFAAYQLEFRTKIENQPAVAQIRAREAQAIARGGGITVAVIDTGIYLNHWYLADANVPGGVDYIDGGAPNDVGDGIDNNGNGLIDEGLGHGTYIAGLVRLVAPQAKLLPIRAIDDEGAGWSFIVAEGIYRAVASGAQVINLSLSVPERSMVLEEAIEYADRHGVVIVAAVGNDGDKLSLYPATFDSVTGVAAIDGQNRKADFSNYGNKSVSVAAPGLDLYGPYPAGAGFAWWSGTSFSTALVAGEAALVYQVGGGGNDADGRVRRVLDNTAISLGSYDSVYGEHLGKGLIDVLAAVKYNPPRK